MKEFLKEIIQDAGAISKEFFNKGVTFTAKSHILDLVTDADYTVSNFLVEKIKLAYPDHSITSEEMDGTYNAGRMYEWVIDPIDGTRNFATGISLWCIIIAVMKHGNPWIGAVYNPIANELFFAEAGKGAYMNNFSIRVSNRETFTGTTASVVRGRRGKYTALTLTRTSGRIVE